MGNRAWVLGGLTLLGIVAAVAFFRSFLGSNPQSRSASAPVGAEDRSLGSEPARGFDDALRLEATPTGTGGELAAQASNDSLSAGVEGLDGALADLGAAPSTLERVLQTFLTEDPDLLGFDRLLGDLAGQAVVVPGSISLDEKSGVLSGKVRLGEGLPEGEFQIDGDTYRVSLTMEAKGAGGDAMLLRTLDVSFGADSAGIRSASSVVQFHPDTRRHASEFLAAGEEHYAGWRVRQAVDGSVSVDPIAMRAAKDGVAWEIGRPLALASHAAPWAAGLGAVQVLYQKISAVKH